MGRWGSCDFKELEALNQRLEQLSSVEFDRFCQDAANQIAAMLLEKVKKRTIPGEKPDWIQGKAAKERWKGYRGGTLRDAWTILPIEKQGDTYVVTVANNTEYASYVEYGHRQTPGRKVGAIERHLKQPWVKGRFMLTISTQELQAQAPKLLEQKLYLLLKEVF